MTTTDKTVATLLIVAAIVALGYEYWNALEPIRHIAALIAGKA